MQLNKDYIQVGFSKIVIAPKKSFELCGYGYYLKRISSGIFDDIYSKALYLEFKKIKILFISCDVLGIPEDLYQSIAKEISRELDIPVSNIFICATHTHSAPVVKIISGCGERDEEYIRYFKQKVIRSAIDASKNIYNSEVRIKRLKITGFSFNRASKKRDEVEQDMVMLSFKAESKKILLIQFSTHATILSNKFTKVSKDYIVSFESLAGRLGFDEYIFFNGACGNILPVIVKKNLSTNSTGDTYISSGEFKNELLRFNKIILQQYKLSNWNPVDINKLVIKKRKIKIFYDIPSFYKDSKEMQKYFEEAFYDKIDMNQGMIESMPERSSKKVIDKKIRIKGIQTLIKSKYNELQKRLKGEGVKRYFYANITLIQLGRLKIVTYPFELPLEFAKLMRSLYPDIIIFCYTNDLKGYIYFTDRNSCYAKKRGSLLYNLFPFRSDSYEILVEETRKLLKI